MKQTTMTVLLSTLILWGCSDTSSTKKSSSSSNPYQTCYFDYYTNPQCPGYQQNTGGSTSGTTSGTTTGTTTSGSTTGTTSGGNYGPIVNNDWQALYNATGKPTVPGVTCSSPTGSGFAPRKGTITMAFRQNYSPDNAALSSYTNNISSFLTNVTQARTFLDSDGLLKVRVMPRPQPATFTGSVYCYGRTTGIATASFGYSQLSYSVSVKGVLPNGALTGPLMTHIQTTGINSCSPALDFSGYAQQYPDGLVLSIHDVSSNQNCFSSPCNAWSQRTSMCWMMDVEVATDTTQTF